ncbi:hypothetical protein T4A_9507 [Trichinella pseudospiralis]|uniref:Uncharacterized protein n=1 Tax=Trichinella pseudospiralis TaxID=6337 RepID=A0A0V1E230_TRIPS|nr:hypothetical protein T4A_9507 [Trichinella pseudospiralis]
MVQHVEAPNGVTILIISSRSINFIQLYQILCDQFLTCSEREKKINEGVLPVILVLLKNITSPENDLKRKLIAFISSVQSIDTGLKSRFACKMHLLICFFIAFIGCMITSPAFVDAEHADQSQIIDGSRPVANAFASQFEHGIDNRLKRHAIVVIPRPGFGSFSSSEHRSSRLSLLSSH